MQKSVSRRFCVLLTTLFLIFFATQTNSCLSIAAESNIEPLWHPVLGVGPAERELKGHLDDKKFKGMINLTLPNGCSRRRWEASFYKIEGEAADQLCSRLEGLPKTEVLKVIGRPAFRNGSPLCLDKEPGEDDWLYFFGGTPLLVRIVFRHDLATIVTALDYAQDVRYRHWRLKEFEHFALGKTILEITTVEGQPAERKPIETCNRSHIEGLHSHDYRKSNEEALTYQLDKETRVELTIRNGRCVDVRKVLTSGILGYWSGHGRLDAPELQHLEFRMPCR